jgi:hypothetical protein
MANSTPWYRRFAPGKKMLAAAVGIAVQFIPGLSEDSKNEVRNILIGFIVGQGIADAGKERAAGERAAS